MDSETLSLTIESIYDAAISVDRWPVALNQLGKVFGSHRVALIERNLETLQGNAIGMPRSDLEEYFTVWKDRNVFNNHTPIWRTGEIITGQDIVPTADLLRSDYYNGFLKPRDSFHLLRISLRVEDHTLQSISFLRQETAKAFEKPDIDFASRLLPHLQRAALITQRLQQAGVTHAAVGSLLEDNPTGIVLLSHSRRIVFANRAAREMAALADSFVVRADRLEALRERDDAALQRLIGGATGSSDRSQAQRGGALRLPRKSGLRDYAVVVAPLAIASEAADHRGAVACVLIGDPEDAPRRSLSMLRQIYGFTRAEARMAERLVAGESPEQAARALGIKTATARVHLGALFRKTETHRQAELIRLLLTLPWADNGKT